MKTAKDIRPISDFVSPPDSESIYTPVADVLDSKMTITEFRQKETRYGPALIIVCLVGGRPVKVMTSSETLFDQAAILADHLPVAGQIIAVGKRYSFA